MILPLLLVSSIALADLPPPAQCDVPIRWRVESVDDRFGLTPDEAEMWVREAIGLWEAAADRELFVHDPDRGLRISFVYDSRHQVMQERLDGEEALAERSSALVVQRAEMDALHEELRLQRQTHQRRLEALEGRQEALRERIEYWEARGGPPAGEAAQIEIEEEEIERERLRVNALAEEVNALVARVNERTDALNEEIAAYNRLQAQVRGTGTGILSGYYRETSRTLGSLVLTRSRQIEIYQFDDPDHLLRAIAHELGHALGLGYSAESSAIMYEHARSARRSDRGLGGAQLHPSDVELLRRHCPL